MVIKEAQQETYADDEKKVLASGEQGADPLAHGVMLISAPRVKNMMPTIIMAAPSRKQSRMLGKRGRC